MGSPTQRATATATDAGSAALRALRENNFDLLRLIAAGQVAFLHGAEHLKVESVLEIARASAIFPGVPVFFVISGFLVTASYERSPSMLQYFANRVLRVYPALWFCFLIALGLVLAFKLPYTGTSLALWIVAQVTIVQFWNPDFVRDWGVGVMNGSLWTIPVELQFYVAIPCLYFAAARARRILGPLAQPLLGIGVALALLGAYTAWSHDRFRWDDEALVVKVYGVTLVPWLYYFLVGLFLRRLHSVRPGVFVGRVPHWVAACAAWSAIAHWALGWSITGGYLNPVSIFLLGGLVISLAFTKPGLSNALLRHNDISYGMYIYHMLIVNLLVVYGFTGSLLALATMLAGTVALGLASWRLLEKPALALKRSSLLRPSGAPPTF